MKHTKINFVHATGCIFKSMKINEDTMSHEMCKTGTVIFLGQITWACILY
jgi:hypothetical protein